MLKRLVLTLMLMALHVGLVAQYGFTSAQLEQRKKHSRVDLQTEMESTGKIGKLLYEPFSDLTKQAEPKMAEGKLLKFLTTSNGLYGGFLLLNDLLDTLTFRFWDNYGEKLLATFDEGDLIEVRFQSLTRINIRELFIKARQPNINSFKDPEMVSFWSLMSTNSYMFSLLDDPNAQGPFSKSENFITHISTGNVAVETPYSNPAKIHTPADLRVDITILDVVKQKRNTLYYMQNGDTLYMGTKEGPRRGKKVSYISTYPITAKGQLFKDPNYKNRILRTIWLEKRSVGDLTPFFDDWMRLAGFNGKIAGSMGHIRMPPKMGEAASRFLAQNKPKHLTLIGNEVVFSKKRPNVYFLAGFMNKEGGLIFDDHIRESRYYEADTVFRSKVKEIIKHSDLQTYRKTTVILENGFVFSISNTTFASIEAQAFVGAEIRLTGIPLVPKLGEVLKDDSYRLIKPSLLEVGNVEFKISDR